jgi:hypothetical protein
LVWLVHFRKRLDDVLSGRRLYVPSIRDVCLPRVVMIHLLEEDVDWLSRRLFRSKFLGKLQVKITGEIGRVPIMVGNLLRDSFEAIILIKDFLPSFKLLSLVKPCVLRLGINRFQLIEASSHDFVGEVEK